MSDLKKLDLSKLRFDEMEHFAAQVSAILSHTLGAGHSACIAFMDAVNAFHTANSEGAADSLSLAAADAQADRAWSAFNYQLQASTRSLNDDVRNAALEVQAIFEQTDNPTMLNYASEYGAIRVLLERLDTLSEKKHATARTDLALHDLHAAYDLFMETSEVNNLEASSRICGVRKEKRTALIAEWKKLSAVLPALVMINNDAQANDAIQQINNLIDTYKALLKQRVKSNKTDA